MRATACRRVGWDGGDGKGEASGGKSQAWDEKDTGEKRGQEDEMRGHSTRHRPG